ncbi:MAG: hydrogenase 4 subunit B [Candidatus Rokubacteria bacterium]|nr:hydrogenase 4 subunit B [Candidatus Rokubacteria bacterium]
MSTLVYAVAALASLVGLAVGIHGVLGGAWTVAVPWFLPLGGFALAMDRLGGFFLAVVAGTALPVSLYAVDYDRGARRGLGAYLTFLGAMAIVPLAANAVTFLVAWELMALASWLLVARERGAARAAWVYGVMTHAGFGGVLAGMLLLGAWTGSLAFADWRALAPSLDPASRAIVFALLAVGFAAKAGVIPLHVWLPLAHPAAPSHVSALMSGVMVKIGIYGLVRVGLSWLGDGPVWWGALVLAAGIVSAVVGVLYALVDRDLKRVLAFSTIENVGIVLIGLGSGMVFRAAGARDLAALAVVAALYHVANHAAFKALLFLGAGSVVHGTGTRNMEALGGLIKRMPWTAATFLLASVAIAGLPPLNGFVSEWLTFQALLQNLRVARPELNLLFAFGIAGLALTVGLAAAAFVRAFGITFLAMPRTEAAAHAHEAPRLMRAAMVLLALACVALALGPTLIVPALASVAASIAPDIAASASAVPPLAVGAWGTVHVANGFATLSMPAVGLGLVLALVAPLVLLRVLGARRGRRTYETWGCGRMVQTARMEYTATAFASPFKRVFDFFYRPVRRIEVDAHPESRFFVTRMTYDNPTISIFDDWLYRPVVDAIHRATAAARGIQSGRPNVYLAYILAALVFMLVFG